MREQIDFLVLAPLETEINALIRNIVKAGGELKAEGTGCYRFDLDKWSIAVIKLDGQGCLQSSIQTMNLLDEFDPEFTVSFGIAGSLDDEKVKLGHVVIGRTIYYYEPAKETVENDISADQDLSGNKSLSRAKSVSKSQHIAFSCYEPQSQPNLKRIIVHRRQVIASGEKVIADENSNSRLLSLLIQRKMACAEMEAAGVAAAVESHRQCYGRNKFIAIKGISDYANKNKNNMASDGANEEGQQGPVNAKMKIKEKTDEKKRQKNAANNAATFLVESIRSMAREELTIQANKPRIERAIGFAGTFDKWLEKFREICECEINKDILKRAAFYADIQRDRHFESNIPMYYHWKQFDKNGLHLVDYLHLILMRRLSKSSHVTPVALITNNGLFEPNQLSEVTSYVKNIIGSEPCYSSEIQKEYGEYATYCAHNGYDGSEQEKIDSLHHVRSESGRRALINLLPYVAYKSRHRGTCIVLCYKLHRQIYDELLMKVLPLQPIFLDVGTINVGGGAAKFESCGKELIINPASNFKELSAWAKQYPGNKNEVLKYIKCLMDDDGGDEIDKELVELTQLIEQA